MGLVGFIGACSDSASDEGGFGSSGDVSGSSSSGTGTGTSTGSTGTATGTATADPGPQAGTLTAGDWDDNLNWDWFLGYREDYLSIGNPPAIDVEDRIVIRVETEAGDPVSNATVTISEGQNDLLSAPTASDGRLLFFPGHDGSDAGELSVTIAPPPDQEGIQAVTLAAPASTDTWLLTLPSAQLQAPTALDLAFVVDATGSMTDEIMFLQAEIAGIVDDVAQDFANTDVRYALVMYRDHGDAYVTRNYDFTADLGEFSQSLDEQSADGGGDYEEAMDVALEEMHGLQWRSGNVARLAFLVADAPPHGVDGDTLLSHADQARRRGIKVYPVAASGVSDAAEYYMRQSAQLTLARYLFLTDDSGVGNSHAEPHIPCYQVQLLNHLMARMIATELSGKRVPADDEQIIRKVGNPDAHGVCRLSDGQEVAF